MKMLWCWRCKMKVPMADTADASVPLLCWPGTPHCQTKINEVPVRQLFGGISALRPKFIAV